MTETTITATADKVSDTLQDIAAYQAFYATVNGYEEPERISAGYVLAVRDTVAATLSTPLSQLEYDTDGGASLVEGRTFRLGISPGIISCRSTDLSRRETTINKEPERRTTRVDMLNLFMVDLETGEISDELPDLDGPNKAEITSWSKQSRSNMTKTLASLDYSDWCRSDGSLAMVTLTLPGKWQDVAPDGKTFKKMVEKFRMRWVRAVGPWRCLWKLEFQHRGAPHWHGLLRVPALVRGQTFEAWLARAWADVVGASKEQDENGDSEYLRHLRAGTGVDFSGKDFSDPRRISMYFAGHSAKSQDGKEYQHVVPEEWQAPGKGPGRFWGFCGLERALVELDVTQQDFDRFRRELRKLARARAWTVAVKRAHGTAVRDKLTPKPIPAIRAPKPRKSALGGRGGQNGGWVLLNDAIPVVRSLAGWLAAPVVPAEWAGFLPADNKTRKGFQASDALARFVWDQEFSRLQMR